jgi:hypothetical protein
MGEPAATVERGARAIVVGERRAAASLRVLKMNFF